MTGISQPHIHNILKGVRAPSLELCDLLLLHLRLSIPDLLYGNRADPQVSLLEGCVGPGHPWPDRISGERVSVPSAAVAGISAPVAVRLGADARMRGDFNPGDIAVLDQSLGVRRAFEPDGLYVIKTQGQGAVRRVERSSNGVYLFCAETMKMPAAWEHIELPPALLPQLVRARLRLTMVLAEWC